ncbi:MAG: iron complex transport system substrate-binding protein [Paraglaciecola sp.]|jgi:iron complex transport system substrate-binding protein
MSKNNFIQLSFVFGIFWLASCQSETSNTPEQIVEEIPRIISLSGFLTEVLAELGHGEKLVGRDVTSTFPKGLTANLPDLGHVTQMNAEAVLALNPTHIFVEKSQINQSLVFDQLSNAGIDLIVVPTAPYLNNAVRAANVISKHLSTDEQKVAQLTKQIKSDSLQLAGKLMDANNQPKVLFIYARGAGRLMVAGRNTSAAAIIQKAGGQNAIQSFEDFRALTPEALLKAAPDVILMFESGLESMDGKEGLAQITGIAQTAAFKKDRIIAMDGHYLTAFGTRAGQAALELANQIHQTK